MKISEVREMIMQGQNGYCGYNGCLEKATELHHRMPDTKVNNKLFPMFLHSPFNLIGLCYQHHQDGKTKLAITYDMAVVYEDYLRSLGEWK